MTKGLDQYNQKRDFKKTKEPVGIAAKISKKLRFVVQHHLASREHYDLRLELKGTMKSWAVPKGPSFNPEDKRLAIHVEDHPLSYRNFEGTIPKGQYGGGTVMIWDEGTWEPLESKSEGVIKFILKGERLKGKWTLIHVRENQWLLVKEKDSYAKKTAGIGRMKRSIRTNRTMDEIANG